MSTSITSEPLAVQPTLSPVDFLVQRNMELLILLATQHTFYLSMLKELSGGAFGFELR